MTLDGAAVVIVGTSPNIGAGIASVLGRAGAGIACVDNNPAFAESCAAELESFGCTAVARTVDATDHAAVEECMNGLPESLGQITGLVNAAVRYDERGLMEMPFEAWKAQLDVVLSSAFLFTKAAAARMIAGGVRGSIVNIASTAAHQGQPGNIAYSTAKAGLLNFTRAAAMDLAPYGIRVNSLTPTSTDPTDALARARKWGVPEDRWEPTERAARRRALLPLGFNPAPTDYGEAALYLLSPASRAVTGTDLRVDAGAVAKYWAADTSAPLNREPSAGAEPEGGHP